SGTGAQGSREKSPGPRHHRDRLRSGRRGQRRGSLPAERTPLSGAAGQDQDLPGRRGKRTGSENGVRRIAVIARNRKRNRAESGKHHTRSLIQTKREVKVA